jgi:hypothetical protein
VTNTLPTGTWRQRREVRDSVQFKLGLASLLIWLFTAFGLVIAFGYYPNGRASQLLPIGFLALVVAALPWARYRILVARAMVRANLSPVEPADESAEAPQDRAA